MLGHAVDGVAGRRATPAGWITWAAVLIGVGVLVDLVDTFAGAAYVAGTAAWLRHRLVGHAAVARSARRRPVRGG